MNRLILAGLCLSIAVVGVIAWSGDDATGQAPLPSLGSRQNTPPAPETPGALDPGAASFGHSARALRENRLGRGEFRAPDKSSSNAEQGTGLIVLKPARVFDGVSTKLHLDWLVVVRGERIDSAGPKDKVKVPDGARVIALPGATLMPGLIDAHTHLLLHPYNEAKWDDQVLKQPLALRVCRAANHARSTLRAGFTT